MEKKITLDLTGIDGNAFAVLGAFSKQAKREGWSEDEVGAVITKATRGGYDNLLGTIQAYCK